MLPPEDLAHMGFLENVRRHIGPPERKTPSSIASPNSESATAASTSSTATPTSTGTAVSSTSSTTGTSTSSTGVGTIGSPQTGDTTQASKTDLRSSTGLVQTALGASTTGASVATVGQIASSAGSSMTTGVNSNAQSQSPTGTPPHKGLSTGTIAAAVIVPIVCTIFLLALGFLCLRRRGRKAHHSRGNSGTAFLPIVQEKLGWRISASSGTRLMSPDGIAMDAAARPVLTSNHNNAYYTGLDSPLEGSMREQSGEYGNTHRRSIEGTYAEPPPPYRVTSLRRTGAGVPSIREIPVLAAFAVPLVNEPEHEDHEGTPRPSSAAIHSPFADPGSPVHPKILETPDGLIVSSTNTYRPDTAGSQRSFTSTLYSDNASVHIAHAARLSTEPAAFANPVNVVENPSLRAVSIRPSLSGNSPPGSSSGSIGEAVRNPFDDPPSPISAASSVRRMGSMRSAVSDLSQR